MPDRSPANLQVELHGAMGSLALDLAFHAHGARTVLFGPSGAGKTSVLRAIAGLYRPPRARIAIGGEPLTDTAAAVFVPPERRHIGFVTQRPALFPHLSVEENVGFGLRAVDRAARSRRVAEMLALFDAEDLRPRRVAHLSGGEQQRIALARALAPGPRLLLLDEPLTGMDTALKDAILRRLLAFLEHHAIPLIYVSHELTEVFQLAAEVLVLHRGRIARQGLAAEALAPERERLLRQIERYTQLS